MCAAPGWMAAQISEQLYSDPNKLPGKLVTYFCSVGEWVLQKKLCLSQLFVKIENLFVSVEIF